jgi:hypothetical protein
MAAAATAASSAAAAEEEEEEFQLRSRLGSERERQLLYEDVLQRLPWEDAEDDAADDEDSMQNMHSSFLSRRWGPQQPHRQQQQWQQLDIEGSLGFGRHAAAEQLLGGHVSEGSVEWYEQRLLEVRKCCKWTIKLWPFMLIQECGSHLPWQLSAIRMSAACLEHRQAKRCCSISAIGAVCSQLLHGWYNCCWAHRACFLS